MLLKVIKYKRPDIGKSYFCVKDPFESKYQLHFDGRQKVAIKMLKNPKAFLIIHKQLMMKVFYENLEEYNSTEKRTASIVMIEI